MGGGPGRSRARHRARPARHSLCTDRALSHSPADSQGAEPHPAHDGALPFLGCGAGAAAARTIPTEYGIGGMTSYGSLLSSYRYDWLQRELCALSISRTTSACRSTRPKRYCVSALPRFRTSRRYTATRWSQCSEDESGVDVQIVEGRGGARRSLRATYVVGCDGSRSLVRDAAGNHPDACRSRSARGAARISIRWVARAARAIPEQVVLQRVAPGPEGLLAVLRARGPWAPRGSSTRRCRSARRATTSISLPICSGLWARRSTWSWCTSVSGICGSRSRIAIVAGVSSSPAMPRTVIHRMADTASTRASRMRRISAGNSWPNCAAGRAPSARFVRRGASPGVRIDGARFHRQGHP